jgi:hypothetical protein
MGSCSDFTFLSALPLLTELTLRQFSDEWHSAQSNLFRVENWEGVMKAFKDGGCKALASLSLVGAPHCTAEDLTLILASTPALRALHLTSLLRVDTLGFLSVPQHTAAASTTPVPSLTELSLRGTGRLWGLHPKELHSLRALSQLQRLRLLGVVRLDGFDRAPYEQRPSPLFPLLSFFEYEASREFNSSSSRDRAALQARTPAATWAARPDEQDDAIVRAFNAQCISAASRTMRSPYITFITPLECVLGGARHAQSDSALLDFDEVYALRPLPKNPAVRYYEMSILQAGKCSGMCIGFAAADGKWDCRNLPGHRLLLDSASAMATGVSAASIGFLGNTARVSAYGMVTMADGSTQLLNHELPMNPPLRQWKNGDVVGAGVNESENEVFFTLNGRQIDEALPIPRTADGLPAIVPCIGFLQFVTSERMRLNFGDAPFKYDPSKPAEAPTPKERKPVAAVFAASATKEDGRFRPIKVIRRSKPTASVPAAAAFSMGVAASAGANSVAAAAAASSAAAQVVSANASSAKPPANA